MKRRSLRLCFSSRVARQKPRRGGTASDEQWQLLDHVGEGQSGRVDRVQNEYGVTRIRKHLPKTRFGVAELDILRRLAQPQCSDRFSCLVSVTSKRNQEWTVYLRDDDRTAETLKLWMVGPKPDQYVRACITNLVRAVAELHLRGIAHRDIKPTNILCSPDGRRVQLIDFGLACTMGESGSCGLLSTDDLDLGTPIYRPKPSALGDGYRRADDLWALGMIIGVLLHNGIHPFYEWWANPTVAHAHSQDPLAGATTFRSSFEYQTSIHHPWTAWCDTVEQRFQEMFPKCTLNSLLHSNPLERSLFPLLQSI